MSNNDSNPNYTSSDEEEEEEAASGSEDEHTTGSESDQPPSLSDPTIKPIRSVPMDQKHPNPYSNSGQEPKPGSATPPAKSKRPAEASPANENDLKKAKGNSVEDESKKQLFQRLWSEDDEIVILKGLIEYRDESGENIISDMGAFYEFIKNGLHVDVSRAQLVDKIRRLRKKFVNNVSKEKNGKDRSFSKSHEQKGYELSKLIWGNNNNKSLKNGNIASMGTGMGIGTGTGASNGMEEKEVGMKMDISRFVQYGGRDEGPILVEEIVKGGMELAEGGKRVELEEKWRSLKKEELEIYLRRMELVKEQALVVLEAVNASES